MLERSRSGEKAGLIADEVSLKVRIKNALKIITTREAQGLKLKNEADTFCIGPVKGLHRLFKDVETTARMRHRLNLRKLHKLGAL